MNALEIEDLSKSFGSFSLQNISLTVPMGSALGLIGENGAGKSTTISLILGALQRDGGEIRILGRNADENGVSVREDLGVVFDESCFPAGLSARQVDLVERGSRPPRRSRPRRSVFCSTRRPADSIRSPATS